ncbi:hypothetical protein NEOLI_000115 [Neolecta irregularis DAH-3]|uniref:Uncharacterized protein n=1 Tax=Neolecta irregularis (strain DAH-3) TaxID=1198029 RepID=A0A1U7LQV1_NEOID|nr:hypothetical protein NEOLI_000115 [Neolecta irregularis DAH-3]|eukprot:OLL25009.1 hypothetical protein NEOLI_000115 [Neolecta irregularis DAH-3]
MPKPSHDKESPSPSAQIHAIGSPNGFLQNCPSEILNQIVRFFCEYRNDIAHQSRLWNLMRTCKQLYRVIIPILYQKPQFNSLKHFKCFLTCLTNSDNRKLVVHWPYLGDLDENLKDDSGTILLTYTATLLRLIKDYIVWLDLKDLSSRQLSELETQINNERIVFPRLTKISVCSDYRKMARPVGTLSFDPIINYLYLFPNITELQYCNHAAFAALDQKRIHNLKVSQIHHVEVIGYFDHKIADAIVLNLSTWGTLRSLKIAKIPGREAVVRFWPAYRKLSRALESRIGFTSYDIRQPSFDIHWANFFDEENSLDTFRWFLTKFPHWKGCIVFDSSDDIDSALSMLQSEIHKLNERGISIGFQPTDVDDVENIEWHDTQHISLLLAEDTDNEFIDPILNQMTLAAKLRSLRLVGNNNAYKNCISLAALFKGLLNVSRTLTSLTVDLYCIEQLCTSTTQLDINGAVFALPSITACSVLEKLRLVNGDINADFHGNYIAMTVRSFQRELPRLEVWEWEVASFKPREQMAWIPYNRALEDHTRCLLTKFSVEMAIFARFRLKWRFIVEDTP